MKKKENKQFIEDKGHYWFKPNDSKFVRVGQYSKETDSITAVGIIKPYKLKVCEILSDIILRETEKI